MARDTARVVVNPRRTIVSSMYTPALDRTDGADWLLGDVIYVTFEECEHVMLGDPAMHFKVGAKVVCRECK
jgi:hypothetical protein